MASEETRLVLAIDYGTTYTGFAFATPPGNRVHLHEIDVIYDWGDGMSNEAKVPSVISYSLPSHPGERQWGANLSDTAVAMVHTKLELDVHDTSEELDLILESLDGMHNLDFQYVKMSGGLPSYTWRKPEEIVEDYLTKVFDVLSEKLTSFFPEELRARQPVDIVVTIPADWSYRAKNSTFRALTRAGFNKNTFPTASMLLISEPEAAAIYTARYLKERDDTDFFTKGECFTLCDAGGGTVDVVSYRVKELEPVFEIEPVTFATGSKCGSIFIDLAFKEWLRVTLGDEMYRELDGTQLLYKISSHHTEGPEMRAVMKEFNNCKRRLHEGDDFGIELPKPLNNLDMGNRVIQGELAITNGEMQSFFDPCVRRIIGLIQDQVAQVEMQRKRLKKVFLVGGFAESTYLQEEIRNALNLRNIQVQRPDTSWTAVVRGAVVFGIEKSASRGLTTMSACPRSFGVSTSESLSEIKSNLRDQSVDSVTGKPIAKGQLMWLIKKGDLILSDETRVVEQSFTKIFWATGGKQGRIPIYTYDGDDIPERLANALNELTVANTLEYDLADIPLEECTRQQYSKKSEPFYVTFLKLTMKLDLQVLKIKLCWKDRTLCSADINL